jgi:hypothetical protein
LLDESLGALRSISRVGADDPLVKAIERCRADLAAALYHARRATVERMPAVLVVLGGTGTGKSTLVNRLLGAESSPLTATSFRRTFTAGPVAVIHETSELPDGWLGIDHVPLDATALPARGRADALSVVRSSQELLRRISLIDTPDLDGDQPLHHAQADRAFRWADAVLFLVTPEKYQMTELLPYYRLAARYAVLARFVMNKVEEPQVLDDYATMIPSAGGLFAVARDDSPYQPRVETGIDALRDALVEVCVDEESRRRGLSERVADVLDRVRDQVLWPLRARRRAADVAIAALRAMESPVADVDVSPVMVQLRRRLQQRSVLYLMGPERMLDRVRQVPGLLARLPRATWDLLRHGQVSGNGSGDLPPASLPAGAPDFQAVLVDQFRVVQARIEDVLRTTDPTIARALDSGDGMYKSALIDPAAAGAVAAEELEGLKQWLEQRWNATPRDTAVLSKLVKHLPGGRKLTKWSEAAPYLLAAVVATHHAFFGPIDLMVIGGWSLATWLTEKLSNEVASRARLANRAIARRFAELAHRQINQVCGWLDARVPSAQSLRELERRADALNEQTANAS